uniref:restriction endonuclease subunit S n=1 Tax=Lachnospira eligens TaxID=39485 RepID=UPI0040280385
MLVKMKDICTKIGSGATPKGGNNAYIEEGTALIRSQNILDFSFSYNGLAYINDEQASKLNGVTIKEDDVLLNITGDSVARACMVDNSVLPARVNQHVCIVRGNKSRVLSSFILYFLQMKKPELLMMASSGATRNALTKGMIEELEVELPSLEKQERMVSLLDNLQNKISKNNQINRNLSEQMQAIFGSIFYSEMEKENKASLGDYLYIKGRIGWKGLKKEEYLSESEYRIINGESLTVTGIDWNKAGYISEERYIESPEIMLQEGDILISKDGTIGKIGYVNKLDKPTSVASGIFVVRNLKPEEVSTVFIYCLLNSDYFKSFIVSRTEGSVIPHLYQKDFVTLEIPILSQEQIELFNSTVVPLFESFFSNQTENIRLAALRDSLLPKLMSGELDVSDLNI